MSDASDRLIDYLKRRGWYMIARNTIRDLRFFTPPHGYGEIEIGAVLAPDVAEQIAKLEGRAAADVEVDLVTCSVFGEAP